MFRLMFKPLVDELPCFGAVCYSLRQKVVVSLLFSLFSFSDPSLNATFILQKKLDFTLKVVGGDISNIPGLADAIEVCICSFITMYLGFSFAHVFNIRHSCHNPDNRKYYS